MQLKNEIQNAAGLRKTSKNWTSASRGPPGQRVETLNRAHPSRAKWSQVDELSHD